MFLEKRKRNEAVWVGKEQKEKKGGGPGWLSEWSMRLLMLRVMNLSPTLGVGIA